MTGRATQSRSVTLVYGGVTGALLLVVATIALIVSPPSPPAVAEFAPSPDAVIDEAPQDQVSLFGNAGGGACAIGQVGCEFGGSTTTTSTPVKTAKREIVKARVRRCVGDPPRQTEDPQSPPCVNFWEGDNGGATTPGVSRDTIRIAAPEGYVNTTISTFLEFFNRRFEFYGRRLVSVPYKAGSCATGAGNTVSVAEAISTLKVFAAVTACTNQAGLARELARRKVLSVPFGQAPVTRADLVGHAPYVWSYSMPVDEVYENFVEFACGSLTERPAAFAGPALAAQRRAFMLFVGRREIHPVAVVVDGMSQCGGKPLGVIEVDGGADANDRNVELAVSRAQVEGATSIVCLCHSFFEMSIAMGHARNRGYQPEWILPGLSGQDPIRRSGTAQSADQRSRLFGLTSGNKMIARSDRPSYQALAELGATSDVDGEVQAYQALLVLASGVQMAGADLTPTRFASGLEATVFSNPGGGGPPFYQARVGFGPRDHAMVDDMAMVWLDATRGDTEYDQTAASTSFCYIEQGRRRGAGDWPSATPPFFDRTQPCR